MIFLHQHRQVFGIPQNILKCISFATLSSLRPNHKIFLTRDQQCTLFRPNKNINLLDLILESRKILFCWPIQSNNVSDPGDPAETADILSSHYGDVIMGEIASQITSLAIVYPTVYSDADQRKHQSFASLAFVRGIHRERWIPRTNGQLRGKCFHLMTSSWCQVTVITAVSFVTTRATLTSHCNIIYSEPW